MTKVKLQIKNRFTGSILFEYESENNTVKETVLEAIKKDTSLSSADLSFANLRSANLRSANLSSADLSFANLRSANLRSANLRSADLSFADLSFANLRSANLRFANLRSANLRSANLSFADLRSANLRSADLRSADLSFANLRFADLSFADLRFANLRFADLSSANLTVIKNDLFIVLLHSLPEIKFLKQNIIDGKINGSTYDGECACLSGTLLNGATIHNGDDEKIVKNKILSCRDASRPIERFFLGINKGDTPENSQFSKLALIWLEEFESLIK